MNKVLLIVVTVGLAMTLDPSSFIELKKTVLNLICDRRDMLNEKIDWINSRTRLDAYFESNKSWHPTYQYQKRLNEKLLEEKLQCSEKKTEWLKDKEKLLNKRDASYEQLKRFQKSLLEDKEQWLKEKIELGELYPRFHNETEEVFAPALQGPTYEQLERENEKLLNEEINWINEELECLEEKNSLLRLSETLVLTREEKEVMLQNIRELNDSSFSG